jgi:PBP1b-binding outer membrane lipoprotein LpoB
MPRKQLVIMVIVSAALTAGCKGDSPGAALSNKSDETWAPAKLTSVAGVPEAQIEAALRARLAGAPPARSDDHKWAHVKRL